MTGRIPRYTLDGVTDADESVRPFAAGDSPGLNLTRFRRVGRGDVVLPGPARGQRLCCGQGR